jgi:hypothetical protein
MRTLLRALRKPPAAPGTPFWRQPGWQLSAAFLLVVLVMGLLGLTLRGPGASAAGLPRVELKDARALVKSGSSGGRTPGRPTGCSTDDRKTSRPTSAPRDVQWREVAGMNVPTSASAGPLLASGPLWWCFARTPAGVVMAAHVIPAQMRTPHWRAVAERQLVPGLGRDFLVALNSRQKKPDVSAGTFYQGFRITSYTSEEAVVDLLFKSAQGGLLSTKVSLAWSEGDWKVVPRSTGTLARTPSPVADTRDFLMWKV